MIWATVSSQSCFCWLYRASPSLAAKNQSDFGVDHLVMSMCRVFSCVVGRGCLLWPVHSLGTTLLAFALLHSVLQGQISLLVKGIVFSSGHVWMWKLDYKESWVPKNWCFWTLVLEKTLESSLDCKEVQPVHPKGNQSWVFTGRTNAEAETPILGPPDVKNWLIGKYSHAGKDWRREEKGVTEDEISVLTIWWCPCVESSLVLLEEGVCYDQYILLAKLY